MNYWDQIRDYLRKRISEESYDNWLSGTTFGEVSGDTLFVSVPDPARAPGWRREYGGLVKAAMEELGLPIRQVAYEPVPIRNVQEQAITTVENSDPGQRGPSLNPKFTFDSFVVGACNQFAHAAATSVATNPSRSYNPLFLYGGVGMGKTHLMHAIGRELMDNIASMRIIYTSSERFMNEMIACIRTDRMQQFHHRYREADVLLIDDIHVLGTKERTQEEFFHTFNELHDHQKQIVISSDSPPKEIPGLVERLRSRFEWGLLADIQPPDLETKMAILDKKAEAEKVRTARRCPLVHGIEDQIERAGAGRRAGQTDRLFFAHRDADPPPDGPAGPQTPGSRAGSAGDDGFHPEVGRGTLPDQAIAAQGKEQHEEGGLPPPGRHVPGQRADGRFAARDRPRLRRKASHHRDPFHKQNREVASQ